MARDCSCCPFTSKKDEVLSLVTHLSVTAGVAAKRYKESNAKFESYEGEEKTFKIKQTSPMNQAFQALR